MTTTSHPAYCAPARCEDTGTDVVHTSPPVVADALDGAVTVRLVRCDEHGPGGTVLEHPTEARVSIPAAVAHLDLTGLRQLRAALEQAETCMVLEAAQQEARRAAR